MGKVKKINNKGNISDIKQNINKMDIINNMIDINDIIINKNDIVNIDDII